MMRLTQIENFLEALREEVMFQAENNPDPFTFDVLRLQSIFATHEMNDYAKEINWEDDDELLVDLQTLDEDHLSVYAQLMHSRGVADTDELKKMMDSQKRVPIEELVDLDSLELDDETIAALTNVFGPEENKQNN